MMDSTSESSYNRPEDKTRNLAGLCVLQKNVMRASAPITYRTTQFDPGCPRPLDQSAAPFVPAAAPDSAALLQSPACQRLVQPHFDAAQHLAFLLLWEADGATLAHAKRFLLRLKAPIKLSIAWSSRATTRRRSQTFRSSATPT